MILTVRDPARWYECARGTIYGRRRLRRGSRLAAAAITLGGLAAPGPRRAPRLAVELIWDGLFGGRFAERAHAVGFFRRHVEAVIARVPVERLLVYEVRQGWGPLCRFLGIEPPSVPFPHLNDSAEFRRLVGRRLALGGVGFALLSAATLSAVPSCPAPWQRCAPTLAAGSVPAPPRIWPRATPRRPARVPRPSRYPALAGREVVSGTAAPQGAAGNGG